MIRYGTIAALLAAGDQFLKSRVESQEPDQFPRPMEGTKGNILLYRNHNAGFPFGFLKEHEELVRTVPLAVTSMLAGMLAALCEKKGRVVQKLALAVVIGGSASNLYDRYVRKYVVDYFSIQRGPLKKVVFNLGDLCVFAGSMVFLLAKLAAEILSGHKEARGRRRKDCIDSGTEIL